ncbi:hypothetical protein PF005_g23647 [Phytophthora fragariae]|uniref:Uncharacterized protein n=2 Tax=Phytophthora TaxID=4783 RepID=A0A6A3VQE3_9STRA|nr:hypothetical protein PF003_g37389 [Phytophthora fragariae]KAE8967118.1 hypothetical protein PR001_g28197 [Phytophthora rubi]KAE8924677.1 hypothetical protein PF009_g25094 [Phytophthora fragariae]KAE8982362.1 hypothetical protein PR002_g23549 [Phytophthora rubi]KAE9072855.1 hypothetical protein PF006_g28844 [Phytophthora fragariae]
MSTQRCPGILQVSLAFPACCPVSPLAHGNRPDIHILPGTSGPACGFKASGAASCVQVPS